MNLIKLAIERPIAVIAAVLMVVMFGLIALQTVPIQLTPDIRKPVISVRTVWPGAAPAEIEREIVNRQEEVFRGIEGLESITSRSRDGRASVTLEFNIAQDMNRALLLVANRLDRVTGYPDEAKKPTLDTAGSEDRPIAWFALVHLPGNAREIQTYRDFVEDTIQDRLERVPGVSYVNVYGGTPREMEVVVDPVRMARYGLTVPEVVRTIRAANASASAGDVDEGKRRYVVRTEGEITTIEHARAVGPAQPQGLADGARRPRHRGRHRRCPVRLQEGHGHHPPARRADPRPECRRRGGCQRHRDHGGNPRGGAGAQRRRPSPRRPQVHPGLRRDRLHRVRHRPGEAEHLRRRHPRRPRPRAVPEVRRGDPDQ